MEITGQRTISTDEISVTSNPYLQDIESWEETELPMYRKKVADRMFNGYVSVVLGGLISYLLYIAFFSVTLSMFESFYRTLSASLVLQWVCLGVFYLAVFGLVWLHGKRSMVKFVTSCHGEIGHSGKPFMKHLMFHIILSALLCIGCTATAVMALGGAITVTDGLPVLETYIYLPAVISPFAYFIGTLYARNNLVVCPVCGRFDTVYKIKSSADFGERQDGSHVEHSYKSERVGTKTITTYYTDGSKDSRDEAIYGSVRYTSEYDDYSSLAKYTYLCYECSYAEETLEEKSWKTLRAKYRG